IDAVIAQRIFMSNWIASDEGKGYEIKGEAMLDPDILGLGAGIEVRKSDTELLEKLDKALTTIMDNGTYDEINDRYFTVNLMPAGSVENGAAGCLSLCGGAGCLSFGGSVRC